MLKTTESFAETTKIDSQSDCLSDVLRSMRISGSLLFREEYSTPWAVTIPNADNLGNLLRVRPGVRAVAFHLVERGHLEIELDDGSEAVVEAGEMAICFAGAAHQISQGANPRVVPVETFLTGDGNPFRPTEKDRGRSTSLMCGMFFLHDTHLNPLFAALPPLLHASVSRSRRFHNLSGVADLMAVNPAVGAGSLTLYPGTGKRDFETRPAAFPTIPGADLVRLVGDVNADGYADAVARVRTSNTLVLLLGRAGSTFGEPLNIGAGWNAFTLVEPAGDYDYDGLPDLMARTASGALFVYPMRSNLTFKPRITIGAGWQAMLSAAGAGAFNGDANGDVIALRARDHALIFYRGNGPNALQDAVVLKTLQNDLAQILGVGDYNGDKSADVLARSVDGRLWVYPGNGKGTLGGRQPVRGGEGAGYVLG